VPQSDTLPCQDKGLAVRLGEGALDGPGLLGDGAQVLGAYTGFAPLAAAGTAAEYVSIGGSALPSGSQDDAVCPNRRGEGRMSNHLNRTTLTRPHLG
tara:strand:+ start:845 stop:1135 length:291 start_codon:yes stop_codon:yes gene_type:complete